MKEHDIQDTEELYADFLGRATDYVLQKDRTPIVWEGFASEHAHRISKWIWECRGMSQNHRTQNEKLGAFLRA